MPAFSHTLIIYNPNSTGDSEAIAKDFAKQLQELYPKLDVQLQATKRAGHGGELAHAAAKKYGSKALIVSVSGDGGYHEVINGLLSASPKNTNLPYCSVLPGGNANDHYSSIYRRPLLEAIKAHNIKSLDMLAITWDGKTRYAHSYAGLGITPLVAIELNKHDLSTVRETWLAFKTFWKFRPFKIEIDGKLQKFDSLIMANVTTMAKHLTLDADSSPSDGKFEIIRWPHQHKLQLIVRLLKSAFSKGETDGQASEIAFTTHTAMPMQLDGEVVKLSAGTEIKVICEQRLLKTFY